MFVWLPAEMVLPADTPVTFHLTAVDVTHGYQIVRTNG
jgi:heme/copper-type cytochrome/quinol oxidase subunit 2